MRRHTNDIIKEIFLSHGFKIKPGSDDLAPYVYEAAQALLKRYGVLCYPNIFTPLAVISRELKENRPPAFPSSEYGD